MADVEHPTETVAAPETPPTRRRGSESESVPKASSQSVQAWLTPAERAARGKKVRGEVPRSSHAEWAS